MAWTENGIRFTAVKAEHSDITPIGVIIDDGKRKYYVTGGYGLDMSRSKIGGKDLDETEFHRFGVLWDETGYTFYIDGVEDGKITDKLTARPEFILISTEVSGYRHEDHQPVKEAFDSVGDTFIVDYVRVFDKVK